MTEQDVHQYKSFLENILVERLDSESLVDEMRWLGKYKFTERRIIAGLTAHSHLLASQMTKPKKPVYWLPEAGSRQAFILGF